jgi:hypothetical protein
MLILQKNIWFLREGSVLELMMKGSLTKFHIFLFNGNHHTLRTFFRS